MYFRGTDDKVWQMSTTPPYNPTNLGDLQTQSNVFPTSDSVYFQGTDQKVWRFCFANGTIQAYTNAAVDTLQDWYNWNGSFPLHRDAGLWDSTGFWNSANALYALIDYMALTNNRGYWNV